MQAPPRVLPVAAGLQGCRVVGPKGWRAGGLSCSPGLKHPWESDSRKDGAQGVRAGAGLPRLTTGPGSQGYKAHLLSIQPSTAPTFPTAPPPHILLEPGDTASMVLHLGYRLRTSRSKQPVATPTGGPQSGLAATSPGNEELGRGWVQGPPLDPEDYPEGL